ncbi:hypothetical protein N9Y88_03395 [Candidatus Pelagibacter bacterium]|nr:hypothetical protein [Candidatus Pelagibacter bacterium]
MKRLLAYLFIVLGLGLTFNVSAEAEQSQKVTICLDQPRGWAFFYQRYKTGSYYGADVAFRCTKTIFPHDSSYNKFFSMLTSDTIINKEYPVYHYTKNKEVTQEEVSSFFKKEPNFKKEQNQSYEVGIKCFNPANNKIETWSSYDTCPGNRTLVKSSKEKTIYTATATGVYKNGNSYYFNGKSYSSMDDAKKTALNKCKNSNNNCKLFSTKIIANGVSGKEVLTSQDELNEEKNKITEEKKKIAEEKRKIEEEKRKKAAAKKKKEEEEQKRIAEAKKKEQEEQKYRILVKKYGDDCKDNSLGSPEFNKCLKDVEAEDLLQAKLQREFLASLTPEEARAYTCNNTFGFRKGSSNFKDCIFKLYTTELELEKLDLEKQLALAKVEAEKAKADTARAQVEIIQARSAAARAEGKLQEAQIQATKAQTLSMQQQAAASRQQAAAAQAQARAAQQQNSLNLMTQGLKMLSGNQSSTRLRTNCSWSSIGISCR